MARVRFRDKQVELRSGESVLEALEREGEVLPSSCRVGVCQSCLVQGTVKDGASIPNDAQEGLQESWKKQGLLLACVCRPTDDLEVALPTDVIREVRGKLVHKRQVREDVVILRFEIDARDQPFAFESGQFVHLVRSDGLTRPYSIASVPSDGYVELHVRRVRDGAMSRWLYDQIPVGEEVRLRGPNGDCRYVPEEPDAPIVLIGSGTGLAPLVGVLREALAHAHRGPIHLFHAGRATDALYLHDELSELAQTHERFTYVGVIDGASTEVAPGPSLEVGPLAERVAAHVADFTGTHVYFCGNPKMVEALKAHAYKHGAELEHLHADSFVSAPAPEKSEKADKAKLRLPILGATPKAARGERTWRQKLRFGVQASVFVGFVVQALLYYGADFKPLGGLLPFMAYDSLGARVVSSALLAWGAIFLLTFVFGRFVCGWACPFGFLQDLGQKLLTKLGVKLRRPTSQPRLARWLTLGLVLAHFVVLPWLAGGARVWQLDLHYKEPWLLGFPFDVTLFVLDLLLVGLVLGIVLPLAFGPRPYCKMVCETGLLLDRSSAFGFGRIRRNHGFDRNTCLSCNRCTDVCPQGIDVAREVDLFDRVVTTDCITCLQCVDRCPNSTIVYSLRKKARDVGRVAGWLATSRLSVRQVPRFSFTTGGVAIGAFVGFVVLPPSYFHTYLLLGSLGGLLGWGVWRALSTVVPLFAEEGAELAARASAAHEREERILPLAMAERVAARPKDDKARFVLPALLTSLVVLAGAFFAIARFVPPRIREPSEIPRAMRSVSARADAGVFHFGVPPIVDDESSHLVYAPLAQHLRDRLGRDVRLFSAPTYSELGRELATGSLDAALLPPLAYAIAHRHGGVEPALQARSAQGATYASVVIARSPRLASLADLRGARVAFTSPDSLSGYLAPASALREGRVTTLDLGERVFAGDHGRALALLADGEVDAAATYDALFEAFRREHPEAHVLARVDGLPNDLVAVHPELDDAVEALLVEALRELPTEVTTRLRALGIERFEEVDRSSLEKLAPWTEAW
ncbi:MAG: PhnD/SsuA/transferrin family substrate-binding protein [Sandaracinus sp.]|nr:PhnD/SsuA/transferrin family substrate-binding protein [Sandaracinus sp.]MCB9632809.1 PhnD/SsuA/transferrin family substrate-binding protein [Sandaracinus sp.]